MTTSDALASTRRVLHVVAAHVLGRRRFEVSGRFGLRASPGGIATPAYGDGPEILRVAGTALVREVSGRSAYMRLSGSTMRQLATFAGTDIDGDFSVGTDTPSLGDVDRPIHVDARAADLIARWYGFGWEVLDQVLALQPDAAEPAVLQLWPEHFDVGTNVEVGGGRVNLGASPGDDLVAEPYLYLGPWDDRRPGDPAFWNAPFGAVLRQGDLDGEPAAVGVGTEFFRSGLKFLSE